MSNEAKVGLFVVVALAIFVVTFLSVATIQLSGNKVPYKAHFKFAGGLDGGKLVRFGGLKAGVITDVGPSPDDPTMAEVRFELREDVPINADSIASISSLNALGDNYLEISPGSKDAARVPPGGLVKSEEAITFSDITKKVAGVTDTAQELMVDVKGDIELMIADLRDLTHNLQELTNEENQRNVAGLLRNANEMVETQAPKIDQITDQIAALLTKVDATVDDLRKVAQTADKTVSNVDQTVTEIREPIKKDLAELEETLAEARLMVEDLRSLVAVNSGDINETIENFRATSENLEQFSDEIRQRPWSLLRTKPKADRQVPVGAGAAK
ncbi:MAG: MCE family protein [Acidobacteria bacterium]|nr:MCE family protein [Acidobacteriota bacterium]